MNFMVYRSKFRFAIFLDVLYPFIMHCFSVCGVAPLRFLCVWVVFIIVFGVVYKYIGIILIFSLTAGY